jgi:hypothetical protein
LKLLLPEGERGEAWEIVSKATFCRKYGALEERYHFVSLTSVYVADFACGRCNVRTEGADKL